MRSVLLRGFASVFVIVLALLVLGTYLPDFPVLGLGTLIVGVVPLWVVVWSLLGAALAWLAWRRRMTRYGTILIAIGLVTAVGAGVIAVRMIVAVDGAGADVAVGRAFIGIGDTGLSKPDDEPVYLTDGNDELRVNVYRPPGGTGPAPVLLFVHGGGWTSGTRELRSDDMRWFSKQGWLALSIDYSLSSPDRHLWDVTQGQVGCALSWVSQNAARYGGDPTRLSLTGDSAGGNLVINSAYLQAAGRLPSACGGQAPQVAAVSALYPAVAPADVFAANPVGQRYLEDYVGGSPAQYPDRYAAIDSADVVHQGGPPTLVIAGEADHLVRLNGVETFVQRAREAGVDVELVRIPYVDHAFDIVEGGIGRQAFRQLTKKWLEEHGQAP